MEILTAKSAGSVPVAVGRFATKLEFGIATLALLDL
jgi:hypothetical protein